MEVNLIFVRNLFISILVNTFIYFFRLHREALKQSATDPLSGKIDVGILTTGLSTTARKKRADLVASIKESLKKKSKVPTVSWNKLFTEIREGSQIVCIVYDNCLKYLKFSIVPIPSICFAMFFVQFECI